jgi:hypothetical protein
MELGDGRCSPALMMSEVEEENVGDPGRAEFRQPKTSALAVAHLGERLCSVIDAAYCVGQALSRGESGGGCRDRGRHEHDGCVQLQERDAEQARTDGGLNKASPGETSAGIDRSRECDRSDGPRGMTPPHGCLPSARRRIEEIAALPAVTAATPPAIKLAFRSLLLLTPSLRTANESPTVSRSRSGLLFLRRRLMRSLLVSLADERPS